MASVKQTRLAKVIPAQIAKYLKGGDKSEEYFIPIYYEDNIQMFHFLIFGLGDEFEGGEYLFQFKIPDDFPDKPPEKLQFYTPNGVFETNKNICISIGEYHSQQPTINKDGSVLGWTKGIGLFGFAKQVITCLRFWQGNTGIAYDGSKTTNGQKISMAKKSCDYNSKYHATIMEKVNEFIEMNPKNQSAIKYKELHAETKTVKPAAGAAEEPETLTNNVKADEQDNKEVADKRQADEVADMLADKLEIN